METRRLWRMWWSGLLAIVTFAHLLRAVMGVPVTVGTIALPLWISWVIFPLAGMGSLWFARRARGVGARPVPRAPRTGGGGCCHPTSSTTHAPTHVGSSCGIQASGRDVDEEDTE